MPIITKKIDSTSVKEIWFPKVRYALLKLLLPKALEIIELPPIPIPIPIDDIKKRAKHNFYSIRLERMCRAHRIKGGAMG